MPKRKEPELTPAEQFKRFKETVKKLEVDETGKEMEKAFASVAKRKPKKG
jgi:hypothetical protein